MRELLISDAGRPRVTWYGPQGERVEFSAKTLNNWVSKTSNLLVDELDAGPGSRLGIALPAHWRTVVWLLAGWSVGAHTLVLAESVPAAPSSQQLDVLITDRPSAPPAGTIESTLVVVALPALATRYLGDVPTGALDAAAEVRLQPDFFSPGARPAPGDPALTVGDQVVSHGELLSAARSGSAVELGTPGSQPTAERVVGEVSGGLTGADGAGGATAVAGSPTGGVSSGVRLLTGAGPERALSAYLAPLMADGSIVIHHNLAGLTEAERQHLIDQEGITAVDL
jgi:uncharacterized protein (TIGR03089 family)